MMLIMHRPYFVGKEVKTEFNSSAVAKETCIGAAQESILLVHKVFFDHQVQVSARVDDWSYHYHRLIAETMVLLIIAFDSTTTERNDLLGVAAKSLDVVRFMHSGAPCEAIPMIESAIATLTAME
jgi:hypothetical protein